MSGPGDSYATITVPEGDPGAIEHAGGQFGTLAHELAGVSRQLQGMPGTLSTWVGPSSVAYANSCLTNGAACENAVQAFGHAQRAAHAYAHALRAAQHDAEQAIADARDAQRRIDAANRAIDDAQGRARAANLAMAAAARRIATASVTGVPDPGAHADHDRASGELGVALDDEGRARRARHQAQDDLRRAERRGHRAMEAAREAAGSAASAFGAAASTSPAVASVGAPGQAQPGHGWWFTYVQKPLDPLAPGLTDYERARSTWDWNTGIMLGGATMAAKHFSKHWMRMEHGYWGREPSWISPYVRATPSGGTTTVRGHWRGGTWVQARPVPDEIARAKWAGRAKLVERGGWALSIGAAGLDQYVEDSGRKDLTTTDRVGRTAGAAAFVGGVSIAGGAAGAWAGGEAGAATGAMVGSVVPIFGTAAGAAVGGVAGTLVGGVVGSGLAGAAAGQVKGFAVDLGQGVANGAVDVATDIGNGASSVWDKTAGARHVVGDVLGHIPGL